MKRSKHIPTQCYNNFFLKWTQRLSREFRGSKSIYDSPGLVHVLSVIIQHIAPGAVSSDPQALLFFAQTQARNTSGTRMTSDEAQGTLGRRKMRGEALSHPFSPSRLPLRGNFHRGRRCQAQNPSEAFQWEADLWSGGPSSLFLL